MLCLYDDGIFCVNGKIQRFFKKFRSAILDIFGIVARFYNNDKIIAIPNIPKRLYGADNPLIEFIQINIRKNLAGKIAYRYALARGRGRTLSLSLVLRLHSPRLPAIP